jgi:type I restriction enzyme M protein
VITGELKSKVDRVWDAFWSGGISNPIEVIEQITYLLFIRRLDDLNTLAENRARRGGGGDDGILFGPDQQGLRWRNLKDDEPGVMFDTIRDEVFPYLRGLGGDGSTYSEHMKDARFTVRPAP